MAKISRLKTRASNVPTKTYLLKNRAKFLTPYRKQMFKLNERYIARGIDSSEYGRYRNRILFAIRYNKIEGDVALDFKVYFTFHVTLLSQGPFNLPLLQSCSNVPIPKSWNPYLCRCERVQFYLVNGMFVTGVCELQIFRAVVCSFKNYFDT